MTNLNAVNIGFNKYCGPAVLSILTGKNTDECAQAIAAVSGKSRVEAVYTNDLLRAADRLGFNNTPVRAARTLYGTLVGLVNDDGMYIVSLETHFVCIEVNDKKIYFCDNHTKEPIPAASSARLLQRVQYVHKVFKKPELKVIKAETIIDVSVFNRVEYDNPEYNTRIVVERRQFNNRRELQKFIDGLKIERDSDE